MVAHPFLNVLGPSPPPPLHKNRNSTINSSLQKERKTFPRKWPASMDMDEDDGYLEEPVADDPMEDKAEREFLLEELFDACDDDGSGALSMQEFAQILDNKVDEAARAHFSKIDADVADGMLTKEEFVTYHMKIFSAVPYTEFAEIVAPLLEKAEEAEVIDDDPAVLDKKIASGHLLSDAELQALKTEALASASTTLDELGARLEAGHMLSDDEMGELRAASSVKAGATADSLKERLAAGHMLSDEEMHELRGATMEQAVAKADALSAKLEKGHMLSDDELGELKSAARLRRQVEGDELKIKLMAGHMLSEEELVKLKSNGKSGQRPPQRKQVVTSSPPPRGRNVAPRPRVPPIPKMSSTAPDRSNSKGPGYKNYAQAARAASERRAQEHRTSTPSASAMRPQLPRADRPSSRPSPRAVNASISKVADGYMLTPEELEQLRGGVAGESMFDDPFLSTSAVPERPHSRGVGLIRPGSRSAMFDRPTSRSGVASRPMSRSTGLSRPISRSGIASRSRSRSRGPGSPIRRQARQQENALAELKFSAMTLLADGLDIGQMRLSDLIDLNPHHLNPLRMMRQRQDGPSTTRGVQLQRRSASQLKVLTAYQSALPPLPAIDPLQSSSMSSSISRMRGSSRKGPRKGW